MRGFLKIIGLLMLMCPEMALAATTSKEWPCNKSDDPTIGQVLQIAGGPVIEVNRRGKSVFLAKFEWICLNDETVPIPYAAVVSVKIGNRERPVKITLDPWTTHQFTGAYHGRDGKSAGSLGALDRDNSTKNDKDLAGINPEAGPDIRVVGKRYLVSVRLSPPSADKTFYEAFYSLLRRRLEIGGRYIVVGDTNYSGDVFLHDEDGVPAGEAGNDNSRVVIYLYGHLFKMVGPDFSARARLQLTTSCPLVRNQIAAELLAVNPDSGKVFAVSSASRASSMSRPCEPLTESKAKDAIEEAVNEMVLDLDKAVR